jgi:D-alanyl-D-alanine carboxypeptidase (penicillin-binding protein 5/6)
VTSGGSRRSDSRPGAAPVNVVVVTGLLALLIVAVTSGLSGVGRRPAPGGAARHPAAAAARSASGAAAFATSWLGAHPQPGLDVHGQADVLVDVDAHQVLWQRDPHTERAPASLAKLVTAMVAADLAPLDRSVRVTDQTDMDAVRRVEPASTVMGLTAGETLTVRELLTGLFLRSGNDAAETLGSGLVPRDRFIQLMNEKAAALRMNDSHFTTPVGLDDPAMKTSPYDLAAAAATITIRYPALLAISGEPSAEIPQTATHQAFSMVNYNKLVLPGNAYTYPGATGMKTAFTDDAGPCMVATATRGGHHLVAVVMHSDNFFADATRLLDYGFGAVGPPGRR